MIALAACIRRLAGMFPSSDIDEPTLYIAGTHSFGKVVRPCMISQLVRADRIEFVVKWAA